MSAWHGVNDADDIVLLTIIAAGMIAQLVLLGFTLRDIWRKTRKRNRGKLRA